MYELVKASYKEREVLKNYKLELTNHSVDKKAVSKKVGKDINSNYWKYKMITYNKEIIGYLYHNKNIINEIYIVDKYRNLGIGTSIIEDIINTYKKVYVYVFKNNLKALNLYKKLNFKVIKISKLSYLMRCDK